MKSFYHPLSMHFIRSLWSLAQPSGVKAQSPILSLVLLNTLVILQSESCHICLTTLAPNTCLINYINYNNYIN